MPQNTKYVSNLLEIGESTLRKWCIELESKGYFFDKNPNGSRLFDYFDIAVLNYFKLLINKNNSKKEEISTHVYEVFGPLKEKSENGIENVYERMEEIVLKQELILKEFKDQIKKNK